MKLLVESIRNAVEKDCLIPALMSSLTIPDAMGQLLYPNLVLHNGKRAAGRQYVKWFDDWAANDFLFSGDPSNEGETIPGQIFNGKMCWKLRCSLLHSGDYDVSVDAPEKDEASTTTTSSSLSSTGATPSALPGRRPRAGCVRLRA